jgi:hypothetical protein
MDECDLDSGFDRLTVLDSPLEFIVDLEVESFLVVDCEESEVDDEEFDK